MIVLKKIKIRGFRGYIDEKELSLDAPVVLLFGENHCGKSSTLNAIEWCLYGGKCVGKDTGIRERINWEIKNRKLTSGDDVFVELLLEDRNGNSYKISRKLISKTKDEFEITPPDGKKSKGKEAEAILSRILRSSFRDFLTTVYQHQEAIRAILTQEPKDRNDAIDRLLGLSDYKNIISGILAAKVEETFKNMAKSLDDFNEKIKHLLKDRQQILEDRKRELIEKGIKEEQFNEKGAIEIFEVILKKLEEFAIKTGLPFPEIPKPTDLEQLSLRLSNIKELISNFRSKLPDLENWNDLMKKIIEIDSLISEYNQKIKRLREAKKKIEKFVNEYGDEDKLQKSKSEIERKIRDLEEEMKKLDLKGKLIKDAIEYLKKEDIDINICPVCGKETPGLLEHLQEEWEKRYEDKFKEINEKIETLRKKELENIDKLIKELKNYKNDLERYSKDLSETTEKIESFLGKKITSEDDPIGLLNKYLENIKNQLEPLEKAIKTKHEKLDEIQEKINQIQKIFEILKLIKKVKILEYIKKTPEFQHIQELMDKMAVLQRQIKEILEVIKNVSHEQAEKLIREAEKAINEYFLKITNNPAIKEIKLSVDVDKSGKNNYSFYDQDNRDLTPILSQGDLNALALSIFLAMASLKGTSAFDFILLDDPSQSLGSEHKNNFVEVLDKVSNNKRILLATMDRELQELLIKKLTKAKKIYNFKKWDPFTGPEIEEK